MTQPQFLATFVLAVGLSACTTPADDRYPSLAIRDVERASGTFEPVATEQLEVPQVEVDLAGGLDVRLTALVAEAQKSHAAFTAATPAAERLVAGASGSAVGSDSWAAAQVALADLDAARSQSAIALGELDIIYTAASVQAEDTAGIEAARNRVIALVGDEDAVLEKLRARVR